MKVNLDEKLDMQLKTVFESLQIKGPLFFNGRQIKEDDTPLSVQMTNNSRMLIINSSVVGKIEPVMWLRTKKTSIEWNDYTNLSVEYWDALKFKARRNVYFCGVGMAKNYEG